MTEKDLRRRLEYLEDEVRALRAFEEAPYRTVVEDMTELVVRWRPDGTRLFVNDAYVRLFGAPRDELIGTSFWPLVNEQDASRVRFRIDQLSPNLPVSTGRHRARLPSGQLIWMEWTDRAIFDEDWNIIEYQSVGRDISERVRIEEQLRRVERADAVARAVASIAHDLVNVFQIFSVELTEGIKSDATTLDTRSTAIRHGLALLEQLRQLAQGRVPDLELVDLNARITESVGFLSLLGSWGVLVQTELSPQPCLICADPTQIDQILLNLVRNSAEAAEAACKVRIETALVPGSRVDPSHDWPDGAPPEQCCVVRVVDHSGGIDEAVIGRIFEPHVTTKKHGEGQGLATVTAIVRTHKGSIRAENTGDGALFEVVFPTATIRR